MGIYLPANVIRFPYHHDDWYYMTDAFNAGAKVFRIMFWIDRPARGILFEKMGEAEHVLSPAMVAPTNELYCD